MRLGTLGKQLWKTAARDHTLTFSLSNSPKLFFSTQAATMAAQYTLESLREFNGSDPAKPVLVVLKNKVFDVSSAKNFYGPGGPYAIFAGNDASFCLATSSLESANLNRAFADISDEDKKTLDQWVSKFESKYPLVGTLVSASL